MLNIYINNLSEKPKILQDIRFANYLLNLPVFRKVFFNLLFSQKSIDKIIQNYIEYFNSQNCILIPKDIRKLQTSFSKKINLKNPKNVLKYPKYFDDYFYLIKVTETDLVELDTHIAKHFAKGFLGFDKYYILNNDTRYQQYEHIVKGIASKNIRYFNSSSYDTFFSVLKKEIGNIYKNYKELKNYFIYFSLGTTAISTKGLLK